MNVEITKYLDLKRVVFLKSRKRDDAINELVETAVETGDVNEAATFLRAVIDRENMVSTGIGMGVALPHAKMEQCQEFFIALGIQKKGIEWKALDMSPVKVIFLIGGPNDRQTEYLSILSQITSRIKEGHFRQALLEAQSAKEILTLFG